MIIINVHFVTFGVYSGTHGLQNSTPQKFASFMLFWKKHHCIGKAFCRTFISFSKLQKIMFFFLHFKGEIKNNGTNKVTYLTRLGKFIKWKASSYYGVYICCIIV